MQKKESKATLKETVGKKIEEIKLHEHVQSIKDGEKNHVFGNLEDNVEIVKKAIKDTKKWAEKEQFAKKTKQFLTLATDGVATFLKTVLDESAIKKGKKK